MHCHALYFDGKSATEHRIQVTFEQHTLLLHLDPPLRIEANRCSFKRFTTECLIEFKIEEHTAQLIIDDESALQKLAQLEIAPQRSLLPEKKSPCAGPLMVAVVALLIAFPYIRSMDPARWIADKIPLEVEKKAFDVLAGEAVFPAQCHDAEALAILNGLARQLLQEDYETLKPRIYIVEGKYANAFALPGNQVAFTNAFLAQSESGSEIAAVLAHELGHLRRRHVLTAYLNSSLLAAGWAVLTGDFAGIMTVDHKTVRNLLNMKYSRAAEEEADREAIALLHRAAISLDGFAAFLKRGRIRMPGFWEALRELWSDHPQLESRLKLIAESQKGDQLQGLQKLDLYYLQHICKDIAP
jgi:Zn-dependent protease with chaperone function